MTSDKYIRIPILIFDLKMHQSDATTDDNRQMVIRWYRQFGSVESGTCEYKSEISLSFNYINIENHTIELYTIDKYYGQ